MSLDDFINKYAGQEVTDPWSGYRGECVSLWKRYAQEVQGIDPNDLFVPDGRAKNIWYQFTTNMSKHYVKVSSPQRGDAAIYDGPYGDVAIVVSPTQAFGQLGTPVFEPAATRSIGNPIGFIRQKGEDVMDDKDILGIYEVAGRNYKTITQADYDYYRGKKPEQLTNDLKKSQEWKDFSYKGSHYDADVKAGGNPEALKPNTLYKTP